MPVRRQVGVGIKITYDPLHGCGRAELPHPALALGERIQTVGSGNQRLMRHYCFLAREK